MKSLRLRIANYILAAGNILLTAILYPSLPDQIPMHWDVNGAVSYSNKGQIFVMCGMAVLFAVLFDVLPHIDPRRKNYQKFGSYYDGFCVLMQVFMLIMNGVILTESFRPATVSVPMITMLGVGILFLFIGNIMPKIKSNFYMGIKNPWTLSSEEVWRKTHRLGGKCFFTAGLFMIAAAFFPFGWILYWITMACVLVIALVPSVMSYLWWRQEQNNTGQI